MYASISPEIDPKVKARAFYLKSKVLKRTASKGGIHGCGYGTTSVLQRYSCRALLSRCSMLSQSDSRKKKNDRVESVNVERRSQYTSRESYRNRSKNQDKNYSELCRSRADAENVPECADAPDFTVVQIADYLATCSFSGLQLQQALITSDWTRARTRLIAMPLNFHKRLARLNETSTSCPTIDRLCALTPWRAPVSSREAIFRNRKSRRGTVIQNDSMLSIISF